MPNFIPKVDTIQNPSPNYDHGRGGQTVKAIVIHRAEDTVPSVINYLLAPQTKKSYHYIVARNGLVYQLVDEQNTAWHSGQVTSPTWPDLIPGVNPNQYTIGVAMSGFAYEGVPVEQQDRLLELLAKILIKYDLEPSDATLVFHREIRGDKTCPGKTLNKEVLVSNVTAVYNSIKSDYANGVNDGDVNQPA